MSGALSGTSPYPSCTFTNRSHQQCRRSSRTQSSKPRSSSSIITLDHKSLLVMSFAYNHLKTLLARRSFTTTSWAKPHRTPAMNLEAEGSGGVVELDHQDHKFKLRSDYAPVYVSLGLILLSTMLGLITVKQHLLHDPGVRVKKSRREKLVEVEEPEVVTVEAERFIKRSFFRRLAVVQQYEVPSPRGPHSWSGQAFNMTPRVEPFKAEAKRGVERAVASRGGK
ncbi:hypothetical protein Droror1_Dr00026194 [Drosera rotundifolia]